MAYKILIAPFLNKHQILIGTETETLALFVTDKDPYEFLAEMRDAIDSGNWTVVREDENIEKSFSDGL